MSRTRVTETLLAAAATTVVAWPLTTLFTPNTWVRPTLAMVLVVAVAGMAGRALTTSKLGVLAIQLVAVVLAAGGLYGRGHLWHGLPTLDMVLAFNLLLVDARETVQNYAAPAPTVRGIVLGIGLAIALTAMVVDHLAVMRRSPAMAGLPLLTAFLISASNSGSSLSPQYFLAAAAVWLVMVGRQGLSSLRRWSTAAPMITAGGRRRNDDHDGTYGFAALGRTLGVLALAASVALPVVMPHLPTRYLLDGLGRSTDATGFSDGRIGLSTALDLERSLKDRSTAPVLSYTSTADVPTPLRVGVLTDYRGGQWRPETRAVDYSRNPQVEPPSELDDSVPRETFRVTVQESRLQAPQLAVPYPLVRADLDGVPWGVDRDGVARVNRSADSYEVEYLDRQPERAMLEQGPVDRLTDITRSEALRLDRDSADRVRALADEIVPEGATRIEAALAIQEYFRSSLFTYSLQLAGPVRDESGRLVQQDPISHFLSTRTGYCVQFATSMVMLARASGIPARMAIGFLPGEYENGIYTVRAADAHAWPELFFADVGWLRFEPTPASQSGQAPPYSLEQADSGDPEATPTDEASATPTTTAQRPDGANDPGSEDPLADAGQNSTGVLSAWWSGGQLTLLGWLVLGLLVGVLGVLAVPAAGRLRRRRLLHAAEDDAERVEVEWQAMVERVGDLGVIPPRGSTPRQTGRYLQREAYLEGQESASLSRVVDAVERSRYAPPGTTIVDIREDVGAVVKAVSAVRRRKDRLRATWWPNDGLVEWRERRAQAAEAIAKPIDGIREKLNRR